MDFNDGNIHLLASGDTAAADIALCYQISELLNKHYNGHPWMIGCNHEAGDLHIQLAYPSRIGKLGRHGYRIHITNIVNHDVLAKKVMLAGGELLERWGLERDQADEQSYAKAKEHGLIKEGAI